MKTTIRALLACVLLGVSAGAHADDAIKFRMDWTIYGLHAPFFLALENGFYREEGLDVKILEGQGSATVAKLIAQGDSQLGFIDYATMAKGISQGLPIKGIFGVTQTGPWVIISHDSDPIHSPKELIGKVVAMAPAEASAQIFPALLARASIEPGKVSVMNPAVGAKVALFLQGRVDAITGSINTQLPEVEAAGAKVHYFSFAEYGVNTLAHGIAVNTSYLAANPETVRKFLRASAKGWEAARKDPAAAVQAIFKVFPQYREQEAIFRRELELSFGLLETPRSRGHRLGWMSTEDWGETLDLLHQYAGMAEKLPVDRYFTNDYVP